MCPLLCAAHELTCLRVTCRAFISLQCTQQPDFTHAKYMYNLRHKPAGKLKAGIFIFGGTALACAIPFGTVYYQQKKAGIW